MTLEERIKAHKLEEVFDGALFQNYAVLYRGDAKLVDDIFQQAQSFSDDAHKREVLVRAVQQPNHERWLETGNALVSEIQEAERQRKAREQHCDSAGALGVFFWVPGEGEKGEWFKGAYPTIHGSEFRVMKRGFNVGWQMNLIFGQAQRDTVLFRYKLLKEEKPQGRFLDNLVKKLMSYLITSSDKQQTVNPLLERLKNTNIPFYASILMYYATIGLMRTLQTIADYRDTGITKEDREHALAAYRFIEKSFNEALSEGFSEATGRSQVKRLYRILNNDPPYLKPHKTSHESDDEYDEDDYKPGEYELQRALSEAVQKEEKEVAVFSHNILVDTDDHNRYLRVAGEWLSRYGKASSTFFRISINPTARLDETGLFEQLALTQECRWHVNSDLSLAVKEGNTQRAKEKAHEELREVADFINCAVQQDKATLKARRAYFEEVVGEDTVQHCLSHLERFTKVLPHNARALVTNYTAITDTTRHDGIRELKKYLKEEIKGPKTFLEQFKRLDILLGAHTLFDTIQFGFNTNPLEDIVNKVHDCVTNRGSQREFGIAYCIDPHVNLLSLQTYMGGRYMDTNGKAILARLKGNELYVDGVTGSPELMFADEQQLMAALCEGILEIARQKGMDSVYINITHYDGQNNYWSHRFNKFIAEELLGMQQGTHFTYKRKPKGPQHIHLFEVINAPEYKEGTRTYSNDQGMIFYGHVEKEVDPTYTGPHFFEGFSLSENFPGAENLKINRSINYGRGKILAFKLDVKQTYLQLQQRKVA